MKHIIWSYRNAETALDTKQLKNEIIEIIEFIEPEEATHRNIQNKFQEKDWILEKYIFEEVRWAWDAFKDNIAISIEFSLIDAIQRDLLRAILAKKQGKLSVLVFILDLFISESHFENIQKQIKVFSPILDYPILLIGIDRRSE